jgi:hypothetical protein
MSKTHHRRRHRRANRTRRGGGKHSAAAAAAASTPPPAATHEDLKRIFEKVRMIAAKSADTPQKISKPPTQSAIDNIKKKQFKNILAGKTRSKGKSAFRHDSGQSDSHIGHSFVYGNK